MGGGLGGEDCGDSPEAELGGDLDGAGDPDTGTDTAAESGSFEGMDGSEGEHPVHASGSRHLFTIRGIIAFLTLFSWGALWLCQLGLPRLCGSIPGRPHRLCGHGCHRSHRPRGPAPSV